MKTTIIPTIINTFGIEIRMKFQFRYVAGASKAGTSVRREGKAST